MTEREVQPAARPHTRWSRTKDAREFLLGCAMIAAAFWGWGAWQDAEQLECDTAKVFGTVETVVETRPGLFEVAFKGGPMVRLPVETGELAPVAGMSGRVCENGHWHVENEGGVQVTCTPEGGRYALVRR